MKFNFNKHENVTNNDIKAIINRFVVNEVGKFTKIYPVTITSVINNYINDDNHDTFEFVAPKKVNKDMIDDDVTMKQFKQIQEQYEQNYKVYVRFRNIDINSIVASNLIQIAFKNEFPNKDEDELTAFTNSIYQDVYADFYSEGMASVAYEMNMRAKMFKNFDTIHNK